MFDLHRTEDDKTYWTVLGTTAAIYNESKIHLYTDFSYYIDWIKCKIENFKHNALVDQPSFVAFCGEIDIPLKLHSKSPELSWAVEVLKPRIDWQYRLGALISQHWVVTEADFVQSSSEKEIAVKIKNWLEVPASKVITHENFENSGDKRNNIALIQVHAYGTLGETVPIICLDQLGSEVHFNEVKILSTEAYLDEYIRESKVESREKCSETFENGKIY